MPDMRLIDELISKYLQQTISDNESIELNKWIAESQENKILFEKLTDSKYISDELDKFYQYDETKGWDKIKAFYSFGNESEATAVKGKLFSLKNWKRIAAVAASILLIVSAGVFFYNSNKTHEPSPVANVNTVLPNDVKAPVTNRATITLANGQLIYVDSANNGTLAVQGNVNLVKDKNGEIVYSALRQAQDDNQKPGIKIAYNTLFNPKGSMVVNLTLSDGTKVWLNSESYLKYPTAFSGKDRKVEITGEAYFEVAHDAAKPFFVSKGNADIQVLGTHFNVNAYDDENAIKVTLLEGSVRTSIVNGESSILKPGEQAIIRQAQNDKSIAVAKGVDVDAVMAWKNGYFSFSNSDLPTVMRQIGRWYDVEVVYENAVPDMRFGGEISRNNNVSQVLKILEESKVHFRIEGKKIIVTK